MTSITTTMAMARTMSATLARAVAMVCTAATKAADGANRSERRRVGHDPGYQPRFPVRRGGPWPPPGKEDPGTQRHDAQAEAQAVPGLALARAKQAARA